MRGRIATAVFCLFAACNLPATEQPSCAAGVPVGSFQLSVERPSGGEALPIRVVNKILPGYRIAYRPLRLPPDAKDKARVGLVLIPAEEQDTSAQTVLEPKPATSPCDWTAPFRVGVAVLVFGPQGLDEKRVSSLIAKDEGLFSQLADYAEQTEQVEQFIESLAAEGEDNIEEVEEQEAALAASTPAERALLTLVRVLDPVIAGYDPLGTGRRAGPATLSGRAAGAFFDNAGGVLPGGGALSSVKGLLFPDTEFRTTFAQATEPSGVMLCAQRQPSRSRSRMAYVWARRIPDSGPPSVSLAKETHVPAGVKSTVPLRVKGPFEWGLLARVRDWTLAPPKGPGAVAVDVRPSTFARVLELDLRKAIVPPGAYRLSGRWDWEKLDVAGDLRLHPLGDLKKVRVAADSQSRLVTGNGIVAVRLEGTDLQFIDKVALKWMDKRGTEPMPVNFVLSRGEGAGPQKSLEFDVDTDTLRTGRYLVSLSQAGGGKGEATLRILPPHPAIQNLPLRVNLGEPEQKRILRGSGLDRIQKIEADRVEVSLLPAEPGGRQREAALRLLPGLKQGELIAFRLSVDGLEEPVKVEKAVRVAGPRPRIESVKGAWPDELGVELRDGELPAGSFVGFAMKVANLGAGAAVHLQCADPAKTLQSHRLRVGERITTATLASGGEGTLFLSLDPGGVGQTGCELTAIVETEPAGRSDPYSLGKVIRLPRIVSFELTDESAGDAAYAAVLKGQTLETIAQVGWNASEGVPVENLPAPIAGEGPSQALRVVLPWPSPSPHAPLYIWLRGEQEGRLTKARP